IDACPKYRIHEPTDVDQREASMKGVNARFLIAAILLAGSSSAGPTLASEDDGRPAYIVTNLPSLGGAVSSGNSLNDLGWASGTSNLSGDITQHATLWLERPEDRSRHARWAQ